MGASAWHSGADPGHLDAMVGLRMLVSFGLSCVLSLYLTPKIRDAARRLNVVDAPVGPLKVHSAPVAYLGGVAILLACLLSLCVVLPLDAQLLGVLFGGTLLSMLGLFDDLRALPPGCKLLGQLLVTLVFIRSDICIQLTFLPEPLALGLTVLWIVGITNAINILDVSDGLAVTSAAVAALGLAAMCACNGNVAAAMLALALAGALLGLTPSNWAPAQIYLGDTGSLFVGATLAALSLVAEYTERSVWGALAPVAFLMTPLLDICLVTLARVYQGKNPMLGSPDHFALRLQHAGWRTAHVACFGVILSLVGLGFGLALTQVTDVWALRLVLVWALIFGALGLWLWRKPAPQRAAASAPAAAAAPWPATGP